MPDPRFYSKALTGQARVITRCLWCVEDNHGVLRTITPKQCALITQVTQCLDIFQTHLLRYLSAVRCTHTSLRFSDLKDQSSLPIFKHSQDVERLPETSETANHISGPAQHWESSLSVATSIWGVADQVYSLWTPLVKPYQRLGLLLRIREALNAIGLLQHQYAGHSFRIGATMITTMVGIKGFRPSEPLLLVSLQN